jgi:autotransporter-associated beta strand protein
MMRSQYFAALLAFAIAALAIVASASAAQVTVDFESPALPQDSYYQGGDGLGGFSCQDTFFSTYFDSTYYSWDNWALSNMTDTVTGDFTNQFSAITGVGQQGSPQYAVGYGVYGNGNRASLDFTDPRSLVGGYFTNTTYAYQVMANGNGFSKQFKHSDGDYFKLTVSGVDPLGAVTGSKDLYLADFRDPALRTDDPRKDDYILNTWDWVDLSGLGNNVKRVLFSFTSTDAGMFGINTPTYFALDNLTFNGPIVARPLWTGQGFDDQFSTVDNWSGPAIQSGDPLQFSGTLKTTAVNDLTDAAFAGIIWQYGTGSITLSGNAITLTEQVHNYSSSRQTLALPITLGATNRVFDAAIGDIAVSGALGEFGGASGITKLGLGKLILSALNTYTGPTDVEAGALVLAAGGEISLDSTITVAAGAKLEISGGDHAVGSIDGGGTTLVDNGATLQAVSITQDNLIVGANHLAAVPEPGTLMMLLATAAGMVFVRKRVCR